MADFYKGYFDDRYSFAHSDKKWYEKHKQDVSDYNHRYYEAHKKHVIDKLKKDEVFMPLKDLKNPKPGDIGTYTYYDRNGYKTTEYWVKKPGNKPDYVITDDPKKALKISKQMVDEHISNVHKAASKMETVFDATNKRTAEQSARKRQQVEAAKYQSRHDSSLHEKLDDKRYKVKSRYAL